MKINNLKIQGRTFLAPLAGITNLPFRRLVKACGCAVVCSEMISAKGIFYNSEKTFRLLESEKEESPLSVQLFGADPDAMAKGAAVVQDLNIAGIIDINFGCSVKKIVKQGAGVALMKTPQLSSRILKTVRKSIALPFTIKIRSGWDPSGKQAFEIAHIAENEGVDAITFHPRTATQGFSGVSNWNLIGKLKNKVSIPVIGNGDINRVEDALTMMNTTGCDAVMVGRAAMVNPFILSQIDDCLNTGKYDSPTSQDIFFKMILLTQMYVDHFGEQTACRMLRGRLSFFVKGLPGCSAFRKRLSKIESMEQTLTLIKEFETSLR